MKRTTNRGASTPLAKRKGTQRVIVRLSAKLGKKLGESPSESLPAHPNPFADWSAHLFTADRTQYTLICNTPSLYSMVMFGRGITDHCTFLDGLTSYMREFLKDDGHAFIYRSVIAPETGEVSFCKPLSRAIIGSMNELVYLAKCHLIEDEMAPYQVGLRLNETPMSVLGYDNPRIAFRALRVERSERSDKPDEGDER